MLSDMGLRPAIGAGNDGFNNDDLGRELGMLLREQRWQDASERERELSLYRSGSAPPTVEGSLAAVEGLLGRSDNGLLSEEELRLDPAYLSYYYSHVNLNPRLPPPILSKEDWRFAQRLQHANSSGLGGIGDRRNVGRNEEEAGRSLFAKQPGFDMESETVGQGKVPGSGDWKDKGGDGLIGLPGITLGRQKSFAEILQDDLGHTIPILSHPSRPTSRSTYDNGTESIGKGDVPFGLLNEVGSRDGMPHGGSIQNLSGIQNVGASASQTFASVLSSSLSRSNTPEPQLVARAPSPGLPPVGTKPGAIDKRTAPSINGRSDPKDPNDLVAALVGMEISSSGDIDDRIIAQANLQRDNDNNRSYRFDSHVSRSHNKDMDSSSALHPGKLSFPDLAKGSVGLADLGSSHLRQDRSLDLHKTKHSSSAAFSKGSSVPSVRSSVSSPIHYLNGERPNTAFGNYGLAGYSLDPASILASQLAAGNLPPLLENTITASGLASPNMNSRPLGSTLGGAAGLQNNRIVDNAAASSLQIPLLDPLYVQYLRDADFAAQAAAGFGDPSIDTAYMGSGYADFLGMQKGYLSLLLHSQKQNDMPFLSKSASLSHDYYGNAAFGLGMSYPGSPLASSLLSGPLIGPASPLSHGEHSLRYASGIRNFNGGVMNPWNSDISGSMDGTLASSLLDEFKNNKTKSYELSEIATHVAEFSADQFGSRFIQQKLETATVEEKNMVFDEIMPQALTLMTDVFGNYVVQKFFDHGSPAQIRELAEQLIGNVLTLSLQMYGCRVIQKAIEVVDLDQKAKMVKELDGHVMRCVRDQNGNHVIQKCIECVPQDDIQFIVTSFYGQVVTLSMHPYGCRVVQRVLEHCDDPKTQQIVMDEIMQSVCGLAQDQYGNYVVQHVLEHGKPHERSAIIEKLAGQIVQMSQQKFASNVIEKCLSFGDPAERQMIVNEMLGTTDENEPLQAMMKDQFANYVVQKVLETCDDQQRELILSRIKVHLNALKKYTYGKHIVARVEKLVAAGERRLAMQTSHTS